MIILGASNATHGMGRRCTHVNHSGLQGGEGGSANQSWLGWLLARGGIRKKEKGRRSLKNNLRTQTPNEPKPRTNPNPELSGSREGTL